MTKANPLVIGNWKMHPISETEAVTLAKKVASSNKKTKLVTVVIMPPVVYLPAVAKAVKTSNLKLGVQHISPGPVGAFTGEISPAMVAPYSVTYGLVGHSERRARGETDQQFQAEVLMLLKQKIRPILCVGELVRDAQANFYGVIEQQLTLALDTVPVGRYRDLVIAYEPVWAIGSGLTATATDVLEMKLFIQKILTKLVGRKAALTASIVYGGSVNGDTAATLYKEGGVDGFLVGGASLKAEEFAKIINQVETNQI